MINYGHTVTFNVIEKITVEIMVNRSVAEFKTKNPGVSIPWVLESLLEKLKNADISQLPEN